MLHMATKEMDNEALVGTFFQRTPGSSLLNASFPSTGTTVTTLLISFLIFCTCRRNVLCDRLSRSNKIVERNSTNHLTLDKNNFK